MLFRAVAVVALCLAGGLVRSEEPLPQPRPAPSEPPLVIISPYYRTSAYARWQDYAVDRTGNFRARVILGPYGAYYHYNGQPYPWVTTHGRDIMPHAKD